MNRRGRCGRACRPGPRRRRSRFLPCRARFHALCFTLHAFSTLNRPRKTDREKGLRTMAYRLRVLLQGIGVLVLFFGLAAGVTYAGKKLHARAGSPGHRPAMASIVASHPITDHGAQARIRKVVVLTPSTGGKPANLVWLLVQVSIVTTEPGANVDPANFYALDSSSQGYQATVRAPGFAMMQPVYLPHHHALSAWIGFAVPRAHATYTIAWNNDNHLVPPAALGTLRVVPAT